MSDVPIPSRKPDINSASGGSSSILGEIFNFGTNVFNRVVDVKTQIFEAEQMAKLRRIEAQADAQRQQNLSGTAQPTSTQYVSTGGFNLQQIATVGLLGVAAMLISK